jgi:SAM-dependent methyltransferase
LDPADRDLARWMPQLLAAFRAARGGKRSPPPPRGGGQGGGSTSSDRLSRDELKSVGKAVSQLSLGLTRERDLAGERYLEDPRLRAAYLLFYWPVSYAQVRRVLSELRAPLGDVLDLGCGSAPGAFAALEAGATRATGSDRSQTALDIARELARKGSLPLRLSRWSVGQKAPTGDYDLIVCQHLLNELPAAQRLTLCQELLLQLRPHGTLLLLEPALRETSRDLLSLRDLLVAEGHAIRAPCLWRGPCQALDRPSDWCHAERGWDPPELVTEIARAAGLHKDSLKMSYLAVSPKGEAWREAPSGKVLRIVSERLAGKGRLRYIGCGPEGRMGLALQDKHVGEGNASFASLNRGDVVRLVGTTARGDGLALGPDSTVTLVAKASAPLP